MCGRYLEKEGLERRMDDRLERFRAPQKQDYQTALQEIRAGRKKSHWMWYIFPQIKSLGMSETAQSYEIKSLEEAHAYLGNELLKSHLIEISNELLNLNTNDPVEVFGDVDSLKLKSSMTLFAYISDKEIFNKVIDKYFNGNKDLNTLKICKDIKIFGSD